MSALEPLVAAPHSPDNRKTAHECSSVKIDRVYIGCAIMPSPSPVAGLSRTFAPVMAATLWLVLLMKVHLQLCWTKGSAVERLFAPPRNVDGFAFYLKSVIPFCEVAPAALCACCLGPAPCGARACDL